MDTEQKKALARKLTILTLTADKSTFTQSKEHIPEIVNKYAELNKEYLKAIENNQDFDAF